MTEPEDRWQALLEQITNDEAIDWDQQPFTDVKDARLCQQLKHIHHIRQVFSAGFKESQTSADDHQNMLFSWGHLHVKERLGEGAYGEVFRAFDPMLNRDVALKLLKPDQLAGFHSKLFIEEAQRIAQVRNRHVLAIHGAGVHEGQVGFWADLLVGTTLEDRIRVDHQELLTAGLALGRALQAVHESGLVHGDVKAANVMLDQNNQLVLMDFGAGLESGSEHPSNHSLGSPMLMAPELFQEADKSPASDIYAMGCLLFKMATGHYPVKGNNVLDIIAAHQSANYLKLGELRGDLPASMRQLIESMLNIRAQERPTAGRVLQRLELIKDEPRRQRKRRMVLGIMASLMVGLLISTAGLIYANHARQKAVAERQKAEAVNDFLQNILSSAFQFGRGREVRVADLLDVAAKNKHQLFAGQPHVLAEVSQSLGLSYANLRINDASLAHLTDSLTIKKGLYGPNHEATLHTMLHQAKAQHLTGENEPALVTYDAILSQSQGRTELHNLYHMTLVEKANVLTEMGQLAEAEALYHKALEGQPDPDQDNRNFVFLALSQLSHNYDKQSRFTEALEVIEQAHDVFRADANRKPTNELVVLNTKGVILSNQGEHEAAEHTIRTMLRLAEQFYGKNNAGYLRSLNNLGAIVYQQERLEEALSIQQEALEIAQVVNGLNSQVTIVMQINLANTYVALKAYAKGEALMQETLVKARAVLGEANHPTLMLEYNLAELLNNLERYAEAFELAQSTLGLAGPALGDSHLITLLTKDNLAVSQRGLKRPLAAVAGHQALLAQMVDVFGQNSPYTQLVWRHLVDSLESAGQMTEAIAQQRVLLGVLQQQHGEDHAESVTAQQRLAALLVE